MDFNRNDWGPHEIINKINILTKRVTDAIHAAIPKKYHKYPSTTILKHANILTESNKYPWGRLHIMTPHDTYSIPTHVYTVTVLDNSHKQKD